MSSIFFKQPVRELDDSSRTSEGTTALDRYLASQEAAQSQVGVANSETPILYNPQDFEKTTNDDISNIMRDTGNGIVSAGLLSLDYISRVFRGVPATSLNTFGNKIIYSSDRELKAATNDRAREIVLISLQILNYMPNASVTSPSAVATMNSLADQIVRSTKAGLEIYDTYLTSVLAATKAVAKASTNKSYVGNI